MVTFPISLQITTQTKLSDSKHSSVVLQINVILVSMTLVVTTGGGGWSAGQRELRANYTVYTS